MRGSIRKRGSGWTYVVYLGRDPVTGKKKQKWVGGFATKRACEQALTATLEALRTEDYVDPGELTVAAFLDRWLEGTVGTVRPTTAASYRDMMVGLVVPRIGHVRLRDLNSLAVSSLLAELLVSGRRRGSGGLAPKTVRYVHTVLAHALDDAVRWNLLRRNPARLVDPPRGPDKEMPTWSGEEVRRFLWAVRSDRLFAMWALLCMTGMRRGEVLGLRWSDIDLDGSRVSVQRQVVAVGYEVAVSPPKTRRGKRVVMLDAFTVEALRERLADHRREQAIVGAAVPDGFVFDRADGSALHPMSVTKHFGSLAAGCGLPRIRLHDLRHTAATLALSAGVHPKVVSERLGHSSVQITLDRYSHVTPALQRDAADLISAMVFDAPDSTDPEHADDEGVA